MVGREVHNPKRRTMFGETRLLSEYLADAFFGRDWHMQFRVGPDPVIPGVDLTDEAERRVARNVNRTVDALVVPPPDLVIIEATMFRPTDKIGRLQEYLLLLKMTPEYREWASFPLRPLLLSAQDDPIARSMASTLGIEWVLYEPTWLDEFFAIYPDRKRRAHSAQLLAAIDAQLP